MNSLWLTADEKKIFDGFSAELKNGWDVENETLTFEDTSEKRSMRLAMMRLHDPSLLSLQENAKKANSEQELAHIIQSSDANVIPENDMAELFFALGPNVVTNMITSLLPLCKTDDDLEGIVSLTQLRHSLFTAFSA